MKQIKIIRAYQTIESLANVRDLDPKEQWSLYQLRKQLRSFYEFQEEREDAIREKYQEFADESGTLTGEKADEYLKELADINNMEQELDLEKIQIRLVNGINFMTAEQLEDFIEFIPC